MDIPEDLEWVAQSSLAQPLQALSVLHVQIQQDVDRVNELKPRVWGHVRGPFEVARVDEATFVVRFVDPAQYGPDVKIVRFSVRAERVVIESLRDRNAAMAPLEATPALDQCGRLRWVVDNKAVLSWQVRRLALEELFFARVVASVD